MTQETTEYRKKLGRYVPFGWTESPENPKWLVQVPIEQEAIKRAIEYRKQNYPFRSIREWLQKATGRQISLNGLFKILKDSSVREYNSTTETQAS